MRRKWGTCAVRRVRYTAIFTFDAVASAVALHAAFWLRFEGNVPEEAAALARAALPLFVATRLACNAAARLHKWSFRLAGLPDALRLTAAALAGSMVAAALWSGIGSAGLPRSIPVLEFFLAAAAFAAGRYGPRAVLAWACRRSAARAGGARAVIVGYGDTSELLARDLLRSSASRYQMVGYVNDDPTLRGWSACGLPVLGTVRDLAEIVRSYGVATVILAEPNPPADEIRRMLDACASCRVGLKMVPASFATMDERLSAALLEDVTPEDLLHRAPVAFDDAELRALVLGRRVLVTGAGGSIGGELARQLAKHGAHQIVMVDMNENELYLRARALSQQFAGLDVRTEVADVREAAPLERLGRRYRPQDVYHAAAHKHVPLMEIAPEEAVKNNVFGTVNVARMADRCAVERFVLISTDKAVNPSSVMGATKRVAELVVRHIGASSATRMSAVRFGNVLGSAGSVVPLFKQQIAHGGPVTVTHPDCTRYFMTIPEAVALVLVAGLGGYGDLCVLEMGDPIRIADLAANMITLAGRVVGEDVRIVYTGLREGEKLNEELLHEAEELSLVMRKGFRVTRSPPPPADLEARLAELRGLADAGDRAGVVAGLRRLVPTYRPATAGDARVPEAAASTHAAQAPPVAEGPPRAFAPAT